MGNIEQVKMSKPQADFIKEHSKEVRKIRQGIEKKYGGKVVKFVPVGDSI